MKHEEPRPVGRFESVTPEKATKWLEGNIHNRPVNQGLVQRFARDMSLGNWRQTHQGIAFDVKGTLIDGQHRLWAVIESGVPVMMWVVRGLPMSTQTVIDVGSTRSLRDRLMLSDRFGAVSNLESGVLRTMVRGPSGRYNFTVGEELELFEKYGDAIRFVVQCFPAGKHRITTAPVLAAITRAYLQPDVSKSKIETFCKVLYGGLYGNNLERNAALLREVLISGTAGVTMKAAYAYLKTERMLKAFLDGEVMGKVYTCSSEQFPLEEDAKTAIARWAPTRRGSQMPDRILKLLRSGTLDQEWVTVEKIRKSLKGGGYQNILVHCNKLTKVGLLEKVLRKYGSRTVTTFKATKHGAA